jgi:hypothetical protein
MRPAHARGSKVSFEGQVWQAQDALAAGLKPIIAYDRRMQKGSPPTAKELAMTSSLMLSSGHCPPTRKPARRRLRASLLSGLRSLRRAYGQFAMLDLHR